MRASISASVTIAGESASLSQTRTADGNAGTTPTAPPASVGELTTRSTASSGVVTTTDTELVTGNLAVLTWTDADGNLKHRYNVACTVAAFVVTISGGAGDDLPAVSSDINIALQVRASVTFDFDDMDTFAVSMNVRGVVALMDATDAVKLVMDMDAGGLGLWTKDTGFPAPITGTRVTYVLVGSGNTSTTSFLPKVLAMYDATPGSGT
jgi:hypothetical protein